MKKGKFRNPIAEAMHETVRGLHRVGVAKRPSGSTLKLLSLMRRKDFEAIL